MRKAAPAVDRTRIPLVLVVVAAIGLTGCLLMRSSHTVYLEEDGSVTWTVLERDVRSDADKAWERSKEEVEYLDAIRSGEHSALQVFDVLGAMRIDSRFLRSRRPYTFLIEGRFESIDGMIQALIDEAEIPAFVELETRGRWSRLVWTIDWWALEDRMEMEDDGTPFQETLWDLLSSADDFQLQLAKGNFVDALHFSIEGNRAVPVEPEEEAVDAADGFLTYCLIWTQPPDGHEERGKTGPFPSCSDTEL